MVFEQHGARCSALGDRVRGSAVLIRGARVGAGRTGTCLPQRCHAAPQRRVGGAEQRPDLRGGARSVKQPCRARRLPRERAGEELGTVESERIAART